MKRTQRTFLSILTLAAALASGPVLVTGCATNNPEQKQQQCSAFAAVYEAYLLMRQEGKKPSEAEVIAASAAAVFLRVNCNWTPPPATRAIEEGRAPSSSADSNGVPILIPPASR